MFVIAVKFAKIVRYIHEIILVKHMLNQTKNAILFVITDRYNLVRLYIQILNTITFGCNNYSCDKEEHETLHLILINKVGK